MMGYEYFRKALYIYIYKFVLTDKKNHAFFSELPF